MIEVSKNIPYKGIRKMIGKRMEVSGSYPMTYQGMYVDVTDMLALRKESIGRVVVEPLGERRMIRRPDLVDFCREHWQGREVYARMVGHTIRA